MKHFILVLLGLITFQANAQLASDEFMMNVCSRQGYDSDKRTCFAMVNGRPFDVQAVNFCQRQGYDSDKRTCLSIIEGKQYTPAMLQFCGRQGYDSDKRTCLKSANSYPLQFFQPQVNFCEVRQTKGALGQVLQALKNRDYGVAEALVKQIYFQLPN